jgi:hypothetical protein
MLLEPISSVAILSGQCTTIYDAHHIATKRQSQSGEWAKMRSFCARKRGGRIHPVVIVTGF